MNNIFSVEEKEEYWMRYILTVRVKYWEALSREINF